MATLSYSQIYGVSQSEDFMFRVSVAMSLEATNVYGEASPPPNHAQRALYATQVSQNRYPLQATALLFAAFLQASITLAPGNGVQDTDLNNTAATLWNLLAGA